MDTLNIVAGITRVIFTIILIVLGAYKLFGKGSDFEGFVLVALAQILLLQ